MPVLLRLVVLLLAAAPAFAQQTPLSVPFTPPGVTGYDAAIPTPEDVLGITIGERHTRPDEIVRYVEAVAAASDRVTVGFHGRTYEGRPLVHALVTRPGRDLDAARRANARLQDDASAVSDAELAALPVVAYMGYSVHGDEASGSDAALLLLYHLAAGQGPAVESVLDQTIVVLDPLLNPDGRARFVDHVNAFRGGSARFLQTDPQDREHNQPWPRGRTNHYWFDLNRDWMPLVHPESRGRMALWHDWRPQLTTDFHEMGGDATYFFQPGVPSRDNPRTPDRVFELTADIAEFHARALDAIGTLYYTRESFDDYYVGKGSTYPDVQGSVGILFEQASSRAGAAETVHGVLTYGETVRNQFATSLSSLEAAVALRTDLLRLQRDSYADAPRFARSLTARAYVFDAEDPHRTADLVDMLTRHRIRVHRLGASVSTPEGRFESGRALVVTAEQPQARLVTSFFERQTVFDDSLFYDVSAWTLPMAYGLRYAELATPPALGDVVTDWPVTGRVVGSAEAGYAMPWGTVGAVRALVRFQAEGMRARLATRPMTVSIGGQERAFDGGAVILPVGQVASGEWHAFVQEVAREEGVELVGLGGGMSVDGPDLGSPSVPVLAEPRVALLTGDGIIPNQAGEVWHLLTERVGMPISLLDLARVPSADLGRYTTIIAARAPFGPNAEPAAEALRAWVRQGGVFIATETAVGWAAEHGLARLDARDPVRDTTNLAWADVTPARGAQLVGGAIFETALDTTHPLAFGHPDVLAVFKQGAQAFDLAAEPGTTVARYTESPLLSGYSSGANQDRIAGGTAMAAQRLGRGRVILFDFNPAFRGHWWGTQGLLLNAVFFGAAW